MRIGILGGGQLAAMMAGAGLPLGLEFVFFDPLADACARRYGELRVGDWASAAGGLLDDCDRLTCDFENVPATVLEQLAAGRPVRPGAQALATAQDRLIEKRLLRELDIAVPEFFAVDRRPDLLAALEQIGLPAVLKTRRLGYDGRGQAVLRCREDLEPAWARLGGQALIVEQWVDFRHECAQTAVRAADGAIRFYPPSWTVHENGILKLALAPAPIEPALVEAARSMIERLMVRLDYVGCLTLELFATDAGLLANEFAPRVHNSAHWTIEGACTSQFENHLRAVVDWPLGDPAARGQALMINWIGHLPAAGPWLAIDGVRWHDYGKAPRPGRKLGHATLVATDPVQFAERLNRVRDLLGDQWSAVLDQLPATTA